MELEGFKWEWQKQSLEFDPPGRTHLSTGQFWRRSASRDLERSDERARVAFAFLFALLAVGGSLAVVPPGPGQIVAWLFAAALTFDVVLGAVLLTRRYRKPATETILEFVSREHRYQSTRLRWEGYSQALMFLFAGVALLSAIVGQPANIVDGIVRMALGTILLAIALRRAKSRSRSYEICRELESHLKDLRE
jgi:hypothetical protein